MTRTLLQQALGALHPQANRAFVEATKDALRSALAAPQPEPVAYVPRCHTDGNYCIVGEYKWDEIEEKPFGLADPAHWECAALYAAPPAAPAPAVPDIVNPITDADIDRIADAVPVDQIGVHITTWHRRFARAVLSAAPAVREPLTDEQTDEIWDRFEQAPTMGYRYFVTRAILAAVGIGGGGNG